MLGRAESLTANVSRTTAGLEQLDDLIQSRLDELAIPGAALSVERLDGQCLYNRSFGDFTMDRLTPIASASKWMTVGTVMALVDDGVLSLDQAVCDFVPEFREGRKREITIRQCLACTSGMTERLP